MVVARARRHLNTGAGYFVRRADWLA